MGDVPAAGATGRPPRDEYAARLADRRAAASRLERRHRSIADARLFSFLAAAAASWAAYAGMIAPAWVALPAAGFVALILAHLATTRARDHAGRAVAVYERGLARVEGRWAGSGEAGLSHRDPAHPYAEDLDLFGPGSLFERIATARTHAGLDTLASWLLAPADFAEVAARQEAVDELRGRLDFREGLAVLGTDRAARVDFAGLSAWGSAPRRLHSATMRAIAFLLAVAAAATLASWLYRGGPPPMILGPIAAAEAAVSLRHRRRVRAVAGAVEAMADDLGLLAGLLARIESEPFASPRLARTRVAAGAAGEPPSKRIGRLRALADLSAATHNVYFAVLAPALLWKTQVAFAVESWRAASGPAVGDWLAAVAEVEALSSLAAYAFENPGDPFPELDPGDRGASYEGDAIAHPLLPPGRAVANDVRLGTGPAALIVSGSNMSGKSTLLRAVGVNAVLAQAGAPVRARRLRLSPLSVGATLRVQDSLQDGTSRFYAEIARLKALVDLASGPRPLLFLLDEILHGTNSHDRGQGAAAILAGLLDRGAIGLITTHDLALATAAEELAPRVANVHFSDELVDGRMHFDYAMRPGVVRHSNAIALMRAVGLEV